MRKILLFILSILTLTPQSNLHKTQGARLKRPLVFVLSILALALILVATRAFPAEAGKAEPGLMVSNVGAPPTWKQKGWDRMSVTAQRYMSESKTIQLPGFLKRIWAKEIAENDRKYIVENIADPNGNSLLGKDGHAPARALYSVYQDGGRTVVASLLDTAKFCEDGPSDFNSTQIHSICPIRVTVVQGQTVKNADYQGGCFLDITYGNPPGGPDPATNASLTRYDRQAGVVELIAIRGNRSLPECAKRLAVPK